MPHFLFKLWRRRAESVNIEEVVALRSAVAALQKELQIRKTFLEVATRYFCEGDRSPDTTIPLATILPDNDADAIPDILEEKELFDSDFLVFKHFQDGRETILDLGANHGYAAAAMWMSGTAASILSFEPNPAHLACMKRIKSLRSPRFDFACFGLGERAASLLFTMPVIEGMGISAMASAVYANPTYWPRTLNFLATYAEEHFEHVETTPTLRFTESEWEIVRLDDALASHRFDVPVDRISAIKIDVEGFEAQVLLGAPDTLAKHRPFLLVEGANRDDRVREILSASGYRFALIEDGHCILSDRISNKVNGAFLHESRLEAYRASGLLRG